MVQHTCKIISLKWKQPYVPGSEGVKSLENTCPPAHLHRELVHRVKHYPDASSHTGFRRGVVGKRKPGFYGQGSVDPVSGFYIWQSEGLVVPGRAFLNAGVLVQEAGEPTHGFS